MRGKLTEKTGYLLIVLVSLLAITAIWLQGAIPQDPAYHQFVDGREYFAIPNFWNVVSNLPFLLVGLLGVYKLFSPGSVQVLLENRAAYRMFYAGIALLAFGSGYYHLWPESRTLVWDRLPMTVAFMALFSVVIAEFLSIRLARILLWPLLGLGVFSVLYWYFGELEATGDLRLYAIVQFVPMLIMPVVLLCFRSHFTRVSGYWWLLVGYVLAKLFEHFDREVYQLTGIVSGHSLKHVSAALGMYVLLLSYEKRKSV